MADKKSQVQKFRQAARELGASDSEASFNKKLKKIAKARPTVKPAKPAKKSKKAD